jgi:hypothetical protein
MHHPRCASISLEARLENSNPTSFQVKQAARSRRVSNVIFILSSVLWHNRQTVAHLILRPKPINHRSNFVDQITKPQLLVLRPKPGNPPTLVLRLNQETHATCLLAHGVGRTCHLHTTIQANIFLHTR